MDLFKNVSSGYDGSHGEAAKEAAKYEVLKEYSNKSMYYAGTHSGEYELCDDFLLIPGEFYKFEKVEVTYESDLNTNDREWQIIVRFGQCAHCLVYNTIEVFKEDWLTVSEHYQPLAVRFYTDMRSASEYVEFYVVREDIPKLENAFLMRSATCVRILSGIPSNSLKRVCFDFDRIGLDIAYMQIPDKDA